MSETTLVLAVELRTTALPLASLESAGRPHTATILAALASVTQRIGLVGTASTTYNEPTQLAHQLSTVDHLSAGRVAWNIVTTPDAAAGGNFRRGAFLPYADRYRRAAEFLEVCRLLWDSGPSDQHDRRSDGEPGGYRYRGEFFDLTGRFGLPRSPQHYPVLLQAGDSSEGRDFAAANADVVFSNAASAAEGRKFRDDIRARAAAAGRNPDTVKVMPGTLFVLGDSAADARERAREIARAQIRPEIAITRLEAVWGRDLADCDPDGLVPPVDERARGARGAQAAR